ARARRVPRCGPPGRPAAGRCPPPPAPPGRAPARSPRPSRASSASRAPLRWHPGPGGTLVVSLDVARPGRTAVCCRRLDAVAGTARPAAPPTRQPPGVTPRHMRPRHTGAPMMFDRLDGHEQVVFGHDEATGLRCIIAIHSTALGPALGGTRFHAYPDDD